MDGPGAAERDPAAAAKGSVSIWTLKKQEVLWAPPNPKGGDGDGMVRKKQKKRCQRRGVVYLRFLDQSLKRSSPEEAPKKTSAV